MGFRVGPANRFTRLVASVLVMTLGFGLFGLLWPAGVALSGFGFCMAVWQGVNIMRERRGRYDLQSLREIHDRELAQDEPEPDRYERDLAYCHRCNLSVPETHSICPECGGKLGGGSS
jgi:hypothetical protein